MRFIRWHQREFVHFVTNRCEHEMFFLVPTAKCNSLIRFWLARAKQKYGRHIEIYAFVFLSNHFHILLRDPCGELAEFMGYFTGNLAKAVNRVIGRKGTFWAREYDDVIVDGENEFWNRYVYTVCNPVKSGLVKSPDRWGGVSSYSHCLNDTSIVGIGFNQTTLGNAARFGRKVDRKEHEETWVFELAIPPMLEGKTQTQRRNFLDHLLCVGAEDMRCRREGATFLGMSAVLAQSPFDRPGKPAARPRFKFMSFCKVRLKELDEIYRTFVARYRESRQQLITYAMKTMKRGGTRRAIAMHHAKAPTIWWPSGCFLPTVHRPLGA